MAILKPRFRLGWPDGSGQDTILEGENPVLKAYRATGCGCCAGEADESDMMLLREVVQMLNGRNKCPKRKSR